MQLDALLRSMDIYLPGMVTRKVIVKSSSLDYTAAYKRVFEAYDNAVWIKERNIKEDVLNGLDTDNAYSFFLVDDIVFYRKPEFPPRILEDDTACYSMRLGNNIVNFPFAIPDSEEDYRDVYNSDWYSFFWREEKKYFSYPLSVDGHIFRTDQIRNMIRVIEFHNPNKFEAHLQRFKDKLPEYMRCGTHSCLVNMPINKVTDFSSTAFGEKYPMIASRLLQMYNDGYRMDLMKMDFSDVHLCHQEIEPKFFKLK